MKAKRAPPSDLRLLTAFFEEQERERCEEDQTRARLLSQWGFNGPVDLLDRLLRAAAQIGAGSPALDELTEGWRAERGALLHLELGGEAGERLSRRGGVSGTHAAWVCGSPALTCKRS